MDTEQTTNTNAEQGAAPKSGSSNKIVIIALGIAVLGGIAWSATSRFTAERMVERAIEQGGAVDAKVDTSADGNSSVTITDTDGTRVEYSAGASVSLPNDWPADVPVMDGMALNYVGSSNPQTGEPAKVLTGTTKSPAAEVMAFYRETLTANGWTEEGAVNMPGSLMYSARKGESQVGVYIAGDENGTTVTLSINS